MITFHTHKQKPWERISLEEGGGGGSLSHAFTLTNHHRRFLSKNGFLITVKFLADPEALLNIIFLALVSEDFA